MEPKDRPDAITEAISHLRAARDLLAAANCPRAVDYVRGALKSAEGAHRHADRMARQEARD